MELVAFNGVGFNAPAARGVTSQFMSFEEVANANDAAATAGAARASGNISWASEVGAAGSHEMSVTAQSAAPEGVVTEAEGIKLHLSTKNKSGYLGVIVRPRGSNTFYEASFSKHYLGCFASAVEAAVAVARHLQSLQAANASEVAMEEEGEEEEVEVGVEVEDKEVKEAVKKALDLVRLSNRNLSRNNAPLQLKKRGLADCASLFTCRHPGCGKTYSCPDAVRKHCRREHSDWLRSLPDLGPTTYCSWEWSEKH